MILKGMPGVAQFPVVPGIDMAGVVAETLDRPPPGCSLSAAWAAMDDEMRQDLRFEPGEEVLITGNKIGQHVDGGYSQWLACQAGWLVRKPKAFSLQQVA